MDVIQDSSTDRILTGSSSACVYRQSSTVNFTVKQYRTVLAGPTQYLVLWLIGAVWEKTTSSWHPPIQGVVKHWEETYLPA